MLSQRPTQRAHLQSFIDALLLCLAFLLAFEFRRRSPIPLLEPNLLLEFAPHVWMVALAVPLHWALARPERSTFSKHTIVGALQIVAVRFFYLGLLLGTAVFLFQAKSFSRAVFFMFLALAFGFVAGHRIVQRLGRSTVDEQACRRMLIVGEGGRALDVRRSIDAHPEYGIRVVGQLTGPRKDANGENKGVGLDELRTIVEDQVVDDVLFAVNPVEIALCEKHVMWCEEVGVTVHFEVGFFRSLFSKAYPGDLDGTPTLTFSSTPRDAVGLLVKRGIDVVVSALALVALSPLMLLSAALIKLTSPGPVIFRQHRVGLNGRSFRLLKFRSMYVDAESRRAELDKLNEMSGPVFKLRHDPRVTFFGFWLRRFSIDELPQLLNVLRGDMSLVGPRPPLADEVRQYQRWQRRRLSMKPGVTCLWQVRGRNHIPFNDWMKLDLEYIDNWSLLLDLKILALTVPAVVLARGAR